MLPVVGIDLDNAQKFQPRAGRDEVSHEAHECRRDLDGVALLWSVSGLADYQGSA